MKRLATFFITSTILLLSLTAPVIQVQAKTPAYKLIERDQATNNRIQVQISPGRATSINFSQTDEAITYILAADPSRLVYSTDADLKSRRAKTIFLRPIKTLRFPGATTTTITNLVVQTVDKQGQQRLYNFDIVPQRRSGGYVGIQITSAIAGKQTLLIDENRRANVDDIETGLRIAINRGYTSKSDPVILKVQQVLVLLRNTRVTIPEASASVGVPVEVLSELGKIALDNRLLKPLLRDLSTRTSN